MTQENKMATAPIKRLVWKMGLPMVVSMVLQALYNVIDSIFVTNMGEEGALANQALTLAFPIQILMIAVGVGTGVGINALLSKSLGQKEQKKANEVAGTGIFLSLVIFLAFLIFGIFGAEWFIGLFAGGNEKVVEMGTSYLRICCCFSLGSIAYTVYERLLQATGKTNLSTIAQISGALTNIVLDYVFIFPLGWGVAGAAWATVIGQFVSLFLGMFFHYKMNREIDGKLKFVRWNFGIVREIYQIGFSATIMQALLSVMMAGMNAILGTANADVAVLVGSFGIYYKIQQIALFSAFGLSNTIISILSFSYGMRDKARVDDCIKYGIMDTAIVTLILTLVFEILAQPLAQLFGLSGGSTAEIIETTAVALRISSLGFVFMGFSVAVQGILQSIGFAMRPLMIALMRLVIFVFPVAMIFVQSDEVLEIVWWTFPIAEILTAGITIFVLRSAYRKRILPLGREKVEAGTMHFVLAISREHGTNGKEIARMVAKNLHLDFYDKEEIKNFALKNGLYAAKGEQDVYDNFLSLTADKDAIVHQSEAIRKIAAEKDCVIVGRAADYILENNPRLVKVFLYAPREYRIRKVQEIYHDSAKKAAENVARSDKSRAAYYEIVTNRAWGEKENNDLCLDARMGVDLATKVITEFVRAKR